MNNSRPANEIGVLHGFRALMVLAVAHYHIWQQGWLGQYAYIGTQVISWDSVTRSSYLFVDGMLLLSAFLLYLPHARGRLDGSTPPTLKTFYLRRAARILPSYWLAVIAAFLLIALPQHSYANAWAAVKDLLAHFSFTFMFTSETYLQTPLNGALWTIAVEVGFYLLFPLLAQGADRHPGLTFSLMGAVGIGWRCAVWQCMDQLSMLVNQLPAFMDVFALGMLGAKVYARGEAFLRRAHPMARRGLRLLCVAGFLLSLIGVFEILKYQSIAGGAGYPALFRSQLRTRLPFALAILLSMLCAAEMPRPAQKLLDNRLTRYLATISMNLYIWHQPLAVQMLKAWFDVETLHASRPLQCAYTVLCYAVSFCVAALVTFGFEKPWAKRWLRSRDVPIQETHGL